MENKKFYTTIKTYPCVGKNDARYTGVAVVLSLSNVQTKMAGEKKVVSARAAINNRTKALNEALGCSIPENTETVWVDVTFWEDRADRFLKFLGERTKVLVGIFGSISARNYEKQDGTNGLSITINAEEWFSVGGGNGGGVNRQNVEPSIPQFNADDDLPY